jgi:multidrug efflux pump subunit AcrA (membrane-fusion protein)
MAPAIDGSLISARCARAAAEVAELANASIADDVFARSLLDKIVEALDARAAALWRLSPQGVLALAGETRLADTGVTRDAALSRLNIGRLLAVAGNGQSAVHEDLPGRAGAAQAVLMASVSSRQRCLGVIEVFLNEGFPADERIDALMFVEEICGSVAWFFTWREEAASASGNLEFWERFDSTVSRLHQSLDSREIAMIAVNEGRRLLGCDRLSLVVQRGIEAAVVAVSGLERVNRTSNVVRALEELAAPAILSNRPLSSGADTTGLPPAVESLLLAYLRSGGPRIVKLIPLEEPSLPGDAPGAEVGRSKPSRAFAALVVEQFNQSWLSPLAGDRAARFSRHVACALHKATIHEQVFLLPWRRALGRCRAWLAAQPMARVILVALLLAGAILALTAVPARFRVEGKGRLMPCVQSRVFAPWDGEVTTVLVTGGDRVNAGQPLVQLRNDDLQSQLLTAQNRLAERQQQLDALQAEIGEANRRAPRADELVRLRGRLAQTQIEVQGAAERAGALERQLEQLTVRSSIAGTVTSFQLEQALMHRPVRRGEVLLEVMDEDDQWRLEIEVPEHRLGHVMSALRRQSEKRLPAEFVLATTPEETYRGEVNLLSTRTNVVPDEGPIVAVHVAVDAAQIRNRRIGAEAVAKIDCGARSLAYVLFGDAVEFVQRRLW